MCIITLIKQDCIPVGCVPPACCPYLLGGVSGPGGCLVPGAVSGLGVSGPGGCLVPGGIWSLEGWYPSMQ